MLPTTETLPDGGPLDRLSPLDAAALALDGQVRAAQAVKAALPQIVAGSEVMARGIAGGGALHYAAAGSSGLMALADCCELSGTFGIAPQRVRIHMAGGVPVDGHMPGDTEDDAGAAERICEGVTASDVFIVLSASGTTPYALAVARAARARGAAVIGIANNPGTPLLALGDPAICLETPPEVIAGSTRLGAGTAQKIALNLMSSLMGVRLGHVHEGRMVNLIADNTKLEGRAARIVAAIAEVPEADARDALTRAQGGVKPAILIAAGASPEKAAALLDAHDGHLGPCLHDLKT